MGQHWKPDNDRMASGPWGDIESYAPKRNRSALVRPATLVLGVAFAGLVAATAWQRPSVPVAETAPSAAIEWDAVQAVPRRTPDAADREWEQRSAELDEPAAAARGEQVRAAFGYCHSGGGTNCVVDGDTFYIEGQKVRIAGIDAPETHPPRCADEARLGNAATERLHDLLNSGAVTMSGIGRDRDMYGRLLRNVAVDGQDVGEAMIGAGVAREYGRGRQPWC